MNVLTAWFSRILELSVSVLPVLAVVLLGRALLLRQGSRRVVCGLWAVVGLRLVLPVSLPSPMSLFNTQSVQALQTAVRAAVPALEQADPRTVATALGPGTVSLPAGSTFTYADAAPFSMLELLAVVWLAGVVLLVGYGLFSYGRLRRRVGAAVRLEGQVYQCDAIDTPFVLGFLRPKIYIPFRLEGQEREYVLLHERTHLSRGDHLVKPLAFLLLAGYWFHPGVWLAWLCLNRDMEISCDEAVLRTLGAEIKAAYSRSLLGFATARRFPAPTPLSFGEHDVSARIRHVLHWKKAAPAVTFLAVSLCILTALVCGTDAASGFPPAEAGKTGAVHAENLSSGTKTPTGQFTFDCPADAQSFVLYQVVYENGQARGETMLMDDFDTGVTQRQFTLDITATPNLEAGQVGWSIQSGSARYTFPDQGHSMGVLPSDRMTSNVWDTNGEKQPLESEEDLILMAFGMSNQRGAMFYTCEELMQRTDWEEMLSTNDRVILLRLQISTRDSLTTARAIDGADVRQTAAQTYWNLRTPYVGDAPAMGKLTDALGVSALGSYTVELFTSEQPYVYQINFAQQPADPDARKRDMWQNACILLALTDNLDEVRWTYPMMENGQDTLVTNYLSASDAEENLRVGQPDNVYLSGYTSLKDCGASPEDLQNLLNYLAAN